MSRILVHVEGQTEENFVNTVLAPHLYGIGYTNVSPRLLGMPASGPGAAASDRGTRYATTS